VAFGLFSSAELAGLFFQVQAGRVVGLNLLGWIAIFAPLGLLLLTSFRAAQMSTGAGQTVYRAVAALMGVSLSLLLFTTRQRSTHLLRDRRLFRCALPLRLHNQARPHGLRQVPVSREIAATSSSTFMKAANSSGVEGRTVARCRA
jgi:hypothetical protein